jgi:cytochrome c peroxidase
MRKLLALITAVLLFSCNKPDEDTKMLVLDLPTVAPNYNMGGNNDLPQLGRVLFYDKQLSLNNSVACASCHKQVFGFADNVAFSRGFENVLTKRNSMPIQNLSEFGDFFVEDGNRFIQSSILFWDGRESSLGTMVMRPILNHIEMGMSDMATLSQKIAKLPYYQPLFTKAFGSSEVSPEKIATALASFSQSIRSNQTRLDRVMNFGETSTLSASELRGLQLFFNVYDCNRCHQVVTPNGYATMGGGFADIGLDNQDAGRGGFTKKLTDEGKFKIPSLRNVELTAPYMHDGRFQTLNEVLDHYSVGIQDTPNLDARLTTSDGTPKQMNIPETDKQAIIAFLKTLTDYKVVTDSKFSSPFKSQ